VNRRLLVTGVATAALAGAVVPSFATTGGAGQLPVGVQVDTSNGVAVGTTIVGQPGVGASVENNGRICAGFSYEVPQCVAIVSPNNSRQKLPLPGVVVQNDENGTTVGAGEVGVHVSPSGRICPQVSTQSWQCIGGDR